ncbi:hypothetical protein MMC07_006067 [Pseudocyphellaria aurata]|nr:hypothetical protein [Pseudocyphellaria aurata]
MYIAQGEKKTRTDFGEEAAYLVDMIDLRLWLVLPALFETGPPVSELVDMSPLFCDPIVKEVEDHEIIAHVISEELFP